MTALRHFGAGAGELAAFVAWSSLWNSWDAAHPHRTRQRPPDALAFTRPFATMGAPAWDGATKAKAIAELQAQEEERSRWR